MSLPIETSKTVAPQVVHARIRTRLELLMVVPIYAVVRRPTYIRVEEIPQPWRDEFLVAIEGRARPEIPNETNIAYAFDWKDWIRARSNETPQIVA
ncbi:hypothetical protein [Acidiphilium acidophilum]|uniref:hypothetical protein n=1 Tax=Acidiphilium acidophilum TaxID=76588 RepID=UPI002E8E6B7F|nr:hypothetical protein [Acidiphilium acidophilum]